MTDLQFDNICDYVKKRLENEPEFKIQKDEFYRMFDLLYPSYDDLLKRAKSASVRFSFHADMTYSHDSEPADRIRFWR